MNDSLLELRFSEKEILSSANALLKRFPTYRIYLFEGEMGSGKTTFIKALCRQLGCVTDPSSPTFSIVNEYEYPNGKIYHMDLYRIKEFKEMLDLGIEEYFDSGHYCFIEWPQIILSNLDEPFVHVRMNAGNNFHYLSAVSKH